MTNLARALVDAARADAHAVAVRQDDDVLTYAQLDTAAARIAALLHGRGVAPGDRVALVMPNVTGFPAAYFGILRTGGVVVPLNPLCKAREIAHALRDSGASLVLASPGCAAQAERATADVGAECLVTDTKVFDTAVRDVDPMPGVVERADDDTAVILYTSGTTGSPKGAELTHRNLATNAATVVETLVRVGPGDVLFGGLPLFHAFGQTCALNAAVVAGATLTLLPRFDPAAALEIMHRDGVTVFLGVPTMYTALLQAPTPHGRDPRLRLAVSGGSALPTEVLHAFEERFGVTVLEGYGLSETSPVAAFNPPGRQRKPGSVGLPVRGVDVQIVAEDGTPVAPGDIGQIVIRGENVMKGYWNRPRATSEAVREGWFHSGDLARADEDGYLFIVDRKKDVIIRGGYNVYPREIEEVLYEHPAVLEAAVVGVPHEAHGEEVAAVVVLRDGARTSADELRDHVRDRVAPYKYPRIVTLAEALPKGTTGKILKREIVIAPGP
ncbi:long-chain-fatty-acid--CoA ligase [Streptomyces sp. WAC 04229]|uniref:long-chain-fatty-acid--CoA ligase n=1 Tax=Streptomyces sp. WAC 04229 TaxID=2203206 RepID=UPI003D72ADAC